MTRLGKLLAWVACLLALAAVFASYLHPNFVFALATQLWNCF